MTDYIQWLLEGPEEEPAETLEWKAWSLAGKGRETGVDLPADTEEKKPVTLPNRDAAGRALGIQHSENGPQTGSVSVESFSGLGLEKLVPLDGGKIVREATEIEAAQIPKQSGSLYQRTAQARRLAGFVENHRPGGDGGKQNENPAVQRAFDIKQLDRAFQRDARRYDGGFPLL